MRSNKRSNEEENSCCTLIKHARRPTPSPSIPGGQRPHQTCQKVNALIKHTRRRTPSSNMPRDERPHQTCQEAHALIKYARMLMPSPNMPGDQRPHQTCQEAHVLTKHARRHTPSSSMPGGTRPENAKLHMDSFQLNKLWSASVDGDHNNREAPIPSTYQSLTKLGVLT